MAMICLLYTSDAADDMQCVGLGCRRIIKKKNGIREWASSERYEYTAKNDYQQYGNV